MDLYTNDKALFDYLKEAEDKLEMLFIVSKVNVFFSAKQPTEINVFQGEETVSYTHLYAIAFNPDLKYSLVKTEHGLLILASGLVEKVMEATGIKEYKVLSEKLGSIFEGIKCKHPLFDRESVIILGTVSYTHLDVYKRQDLL